MQVSKIDFLMHFYNSFVAGDVTCSLFSSSNVGSQIMLSSAGMKDLDSLPGGEEKKENRLL
jgi:hypothetical protein